MVHWSLQTWQAKKKKKNLAEVAWLEIINWTETQSAAFLVTVQRCNRPHAPLWVGEIHTQQHTLLFAGEGGDNDQIPDSDRADGLQLHCLVTMQE